jgi:hypothetical protein
LAVNGLRSGSRTLPVFFGIFLKIYVRKAKLSRKGQFAEANEELRRGDAVGSKRPDWCDPSGHWVREAESLAEIDHQLSAVVEGKHTLADNTERLALAQFCVKHKKYLAAALRCYEDARAANPKLADDPWNLHRYNAACAAVLADCGEGNDADKFDEKERARLRKQAQDWLKADLHIWTKEADESPRSVWSELKHCQADANFTGVRDKDALAKLPAEECAAWQQLWAEVEAVLRKTGNKSK